MKRDKKRWLIDTLLLALTTLVLLTYIAMNMPTDDVHIVKTIVDEYIPRTPVFVVPYLLFIPWLYGTLLYAWYKNRSFHRLAFSFIIINLIAFTVYMTFQTVVARDPIVSDDIFSRVLQFIYDNDLPYAALPSLHSGLSAAMATYYVMTKGKYYWLAIVMAFLIVLSTLFTKQHYILDAISGVTLGVLTTWLMFYYFKEKKES